jgi:hypothetical protein
MLLQAHGNYKTHPSIVVHVRVCVRLCVPVCVCVHVCLKLRIRSPLRLQEVGAQKADLGLHGGGGHCKVGTPSWLQLAAMPLLNS